MDTIPDEPKPEPPTAADTKPDEPVEARPRVARTISDEPAGEPSPPQKGVPDEPKRDKPWRRITITVLVIVALIGGGVAAGYRPFLDWYIRREALARGFQIDFTEFSVVPDRVALQQVSIHLVGVSNVDVRCDKLVVELQDTEPLRVQCQGGSADVTGSPDELQPMLASFAKEHAKSVKLPILADGEFRYGGRDNPVVALKGDMKSLGDGDLTFEGTFRSKQTQLGALSFHRTKDAKVHMGFGFMLSDKPVIHLTFDAAVVPFKGTVSFGAQKVDDVCRRFSLPVPKGLSGSTIEGTVTFALDGSLPTTPHHGTASFVLNGWVPPHPRELDGIVYGKTTKLGTTFEVLPDLSEVRFTKATVDAGALHLEGKGNAVREGFSAVTKMDLKGSVACSEIGVSAIGSFLPPVPAVVGNILRHVTRKTLGGTVNIRVQVEASTDALSDAKVDQAIDIGCRVR